MKKILLSALVIAAMTSCSQKSNENEPQVEGDKIIQALSEVANTKAILEDKSAFDFTYVMAEDATTGQEESVIFDPANSDAGQHAAGGAIKFKNGENLLTYNKNNNYAYFRCFAPKKDPAAGKLTWTADGITDVLISDVWNAGNYETPTTSGLLFKHALAKLEVTTKVADGENEPLVKAAWGKIKSVTVVNFSDVIIYDIATKAVSYGETAEPIQLFDNYDAATYTQVEIGKTSCAMIVPSNTSTTDKKDVELKIITTRNGLGGETETTTTLTVTLSNDIVAGSRYGINILFTLNNVPVAGKSSTVGSWAEGGNNNNGTVKPTDPIV